MTSSNSASTSAESPEQISDTLREQFPERPEMHLATEGIYQALYHPERTGLDRGVVRKLRTGRSCRRRRRRTDQRATRFVDLGTLVSRRPAEAEDRTAPGHREGDLIMGAGKRSAIATLVERSSRFMILLHLPDGRTAEHVRDALISHLECVPKPLARSLTWDQGTEMSRHGESTLATDVPVYFCDPAGPRQRGSNENTNGLLRQYFPKETDLSIHAAQDLAAVAAELNGRPRKVLGWQSPVSRFDAPVTALC